MNPIAASTEAADESTDRLNDLEKELWGQLTAALQQKDSSFRNIVFATRTDDIAAGADARMVVLRDVDAAQKRIWFHTDVRSEKVAQLLAFPRATLLFWDEKQQIQLRLMVEIRLHTNDSSADEQWKNLWVGGRKTYLSEQKPGSAQATPYPGFPAQLGEELPSEEESEKGRGNFAAIECWVNSLEYLHLSRSGQTRARFSYEPDRHFNWLAP